MNDEIREAIMQFQTAIDFKEAPMPMNYSIDLENAKMLLNYITNLQKENEELKEENKQIFSKVNDDELLISNAMNYAEAQDYKSRVEKVVEYFKYQLENLDFYEDTKARMLCAMGITLLQNGSDEE